MNDAFIQRERDELNQVVDTMNNRQKTTLMPRVKRISYLLNLLEKSGVSGKQKGSIMKEVETQNDKVALSRTLMNKVSRSASRHGQAQAIADIESFKEGSKPIPVSKNLYKNDEVGEQVEQEPFNRRSFQPNPFDETTAQVPKENMILGEDVDANNNLLSN